MLGISPLGWLHSLGSLPAIPLAAYMLVRHGRIVPRSPAGVAYLCFMLLGASTVYLIARQPVSHGIATITLFLLGIGYVAGRATGLGRARRYIETIALTTTVFLLMVPTVTETLLRVPVGRPLASSPDAPLLLGLHAMLLAALVVGIALQVRALRKPAWVADAGGRR